MPDGEPLTILLVEDDPIDAALFKALLGHTSDFTQLHADSVGQARELLAQHDIDLVVLDLGLPDSPYDATYVTLRVEAPDIPIIVLTSHDDDDAAYQALADGAQDYLVKNDVTETLLAKSIRYSVERHRASIGRRRQRVDELEIYESLAPERAGHEIAPPIAEVAPDELARSLEQYEHILNLAVESGLSATESELTVQIVDLAARLADVGATPRDLATLHTTVLGDRQQTLDRDRFALHEEVSRLLLLRLTGELANQYRSRGAVEPAGADDQATLPPDARDLVIDALAHLLEQRPLESISVEDLAQQAGLPGASLKQVIGSVREPLAALVRRELARQRDLADVLLSPTRSGPDLSTTANLLVETVVELWRTGQTITTAAMAAAGDDTIQGLRLRHLRHLGTQALELLTAVDPGIVDDRDVQCAVGELFAVLDQRLLVGELFPITQTREQAVAELAARLVGQQAAGGPAPADEPTTEAPPTPSRLNETDYTAWADRMKTRRRSEIDSLYAEAPAPTQDPRWSPEALFEPTDPE